jgi:hypothetical protein
LLIWTWIKNTIGYVGLGAIITLTSLYLLYMADIGAPSRYAHNILLSIDQSVNVVLGGDPDETISSRLGKWLTSDQKTFGDKIRRGFAWVICPPLDILNLESDHCRKSIDNEEGKDRVVK